MAKTKRPARRAVARGAKKTTKARGASAKASAKTSAKKPARAAAKKPARPAATTKKRAARKAGPRTTAVGAAKKKPAVKRARATKPATSAATTPSANTSAATVVATVVVAAVVGAPAGGASLRAQRKQLLDAKTVAALKAMLHKNDQIVTGSKGELVERALDRIENGNMPRCPTCGLGRLRVSYSGGFFCPGGYDDDEYMACEFTAAEGVLERPPWQFETTGSLV